ncbi:MAG: hypothetical protein OEZ06_25105 [Myxococcales bacterium]|nr:hypothetical protein [Myxococcales bacterium]
MKHFLLRLALFLSLLSLTCAALVVGTVELHRRTIDRCTLGAEIDTVIAGDSHTMWAIDDSQLPGLRNISLNAEGYRYTYLKLRHLLQTDHRIATIYIGVSYHNFAGYYDEYIYGVTFHDYLERYLSLLSRADYEGLVRYAPQHSLGLARSIVQRGFRPGLKGECLMYGQFPAEQKTQVFDASKMQARLEEQFYRSNRVVEPSVSNVEYLQKIVDLCRAHGLRVAALATPLHPEYERRIPASYRRLLRHFLQDSGLPYYDFADLTLSDAEFLPDGDHTNYAGAMTTTRRFKRYHEGG